MAKNKTVIKVRWIPNVESGVAIFELEDLDCESIKVWDNLSAHEQSTRIRKLLDNLPDQPYMVTDQYFSVEK